MLNRFISAGNVGCEKPIFREGYSLVKDELNMFF